MLGLRNSERQRGSKGDAMKHRMTDAEIDAQLAKLAAMSDDDIDTDDIPEVSAENWALAKLPGLYRPLKRHITMRLDADVIEWF